MSSRSLMPKLVKPYYREKPPSEEPSLKIRTRRRVNNRDKLLLKDLATEQTRGPKVVSSDEDCGNGREEEPQVDNLARRLNLGLLENFDRKPVRCPPDGSYEPLLTQCA